MAKKRCVVSCDFGGSHFTCAGCDPNGIILGKPNRIDIDASQPAEVITQQMATAIKQVMARLQNLDFTVIGVGIGSPGPMDMERGIILDTPNLVTLQNWHLAEKLSQALDGILVIINNDANVMIAGEAFAGLGKDCSIVYGVTLGTGFGHGLIINGQIISGANGMAMEHAITPANINGSITIEDLCSGRAIVALYQELKKGNDPDLSTALEIAQTAKNQNVPGNQIATAVYRQYGENLAYCVAPMINSLDPHCFVLCGSITKDFDLFGITMQEIWRQKNWVNNRTLKNMIVGPGKLGENAAIIGAASLIWNRQ